MANKEPIKQKSPKMIYSESVCCVRIPFLSLFFKIQQIDPTRLGKQMQSNHINNGTCKKLKLHVNTRQTKTHIISNSVFFSSAEPKAEMEMEIKALGEGHSEDVVPERKKKRN